jgi:hypothetical protein
MPFLKLGPKSLSFADLASGTSIRPGEIVEVPSISWRIKAALKGKALIQVTEGEYQAFKGPKTTEPVVEPAPVIPPVEGEGHKPETDTPETDTPETDELMALTRKEIMEKYKFLDDEDLAMANSKPNKTELIEYLRSIEAEYQ